MPPWSLYDSVPTSLLPPLSDQLAQWVPPAFYPASVHGMSLWDRLIVLGANGAIRLVKRVSSALGIVPPAMSDLDPGTLKGRLTLVNSIPGLDYPQPLPPLIQYTGPVVEIDKLESFPPEVEAWLETVPDGKPVVYVSYGTAAVLSPGQVQHMLTSLSGEDFYVLWALPKAQQAGVPADLPRNMMIHHWIPTPRALAHPKVKAFVSHCGGNSVSESMAMGKPIIGYPQFGDQPANCQRVADAGAGITAAKTQSWVKREHVLEVLSNPSYEKRAQVLQRLFKAFGGAQKAADLLEIGASGDFALMIPATEHSFWSWFTLNGYDISLVLFVASSLIMCRAVSCLFGRGRVTADKLKMN